MNCNRHSWSVLVKIYALSKQAVNLSKPARRVTKEVEDKLKEKFNGNIQWGAIKYSFIRKNSPPFPLSMLEVTTPTFYNTLAFWLSIGITCRQKDRDIGFLCLTSSGVDIEIGMRRPLNTLKDSYDSIKANTIIPDSIKSLDGFVEYGGDGASNDWWLFGFSPEKVCDIKPSNDYLDNVNIDNLVEFLCDIYNKWNVCQASTE